MCLAVPARILEINENKAKLDYGGIIREANISLVTPKIGDFVIVHAGYAIRILNPEEANKTLELWNKYLDFMDEMDKEEGKNATNNVEISR